MTGSEAHTENPLVTVVITTYNRPEYLRQAVETVSNQEYEPIELVVVDDCSQTPASEVLEGLSPDVTSLEIHRHDENRGANAARNTGVEAATGRYIAFLDDDDRWSPEKLARQVETIRNADDDVGLVYVGRKLVSGDTVCGYSIPRPIDGNITKALLCQNVVYSQSTVLVRADVAKETPFDERFPRWADLEWYVAVSTKCGFIAIPEPLVIYEHESHNRISDDYETLLEAYRLFIGKYRGLAAEYGRLFERKMLGYAAYRVGKAALNGRQYDMARWYFLKAIARYPVEPSFYKYAAAASGGRATHKAARVTKQLLSSLSTAVDRA